MQKTFKEESAFEEAVVANLIENGWKGGVLKYPNAQDLLDNWADILFENNKEQDRLNGCRLTEGEMQQIIEQITSLRTPMKLNGFINGKSVTITRDNEEDALHFGKEVALYIYDRQDIAGGRSTYQIAQQPQFSTRSKMLNQRRGDLMLLINGMPLIHIELKRSSVPVSQACNQIEKYMHEGVFERIFSLVQIFVAMTPEETVYFANPGREGNFSLYRFHWGDFNNEPVNNWKKVIRNLLNIPLAHQLIGFYTVADAKDNTLKVMRSYQYYAASGISHRLSNAKWGENYSRGGYVWHTTGSGKTMTSFKSAQLIASSKDADKVVFLVDRIELGSQSLGEYRNFADDSQSVQGTENADELKARLRSDDPANTLIVTSIQKMSKIKDDEEGWMTSSDLDIMRSKRIVFIVDECHRSTFGDMMQTIRRAFPQAKFFGFTGTPIQEENQKKSNTTTDIFGDEIHRYSIADGIRDKNVLGFDPYKMPTFKDREMRSQVALYMAKAQSAEDARANPAKNKVYERFMNKAKVPMAGSYKDNGNYEKGIEDYVPKSQWSGSDGQGNKEHFNEVIKDIQENWDTFSKGKFHAILATNSIPEAITYFRMIKEAMPRLNITALFDPNIDNDGGFAFKEDGLVQILTDYNKLFDKDFTVPKHALFKKDVAARLAHKRPYTNLKPGEQIDLIIVVDQMLTGFDSKWINTLYLDKVLQYEHLIQAFSRTNRLFGPEKPFGVIRYYRKPHTMEKNVERAVKLYSGDRPMGLFVQKLEKNLEYLNSTYSQIKDVFESAGVDNFASLPSSQAACGKFAKLFKEMSEYLEAAKIQGFRWDKLCYTFEHAEGDTSVQLNFSENDYLVLAMRYKELSQGGEGEGISCDVPFDIQGYLTEIDTGLIDTDYMNDNFEKWLKQLDKGGADLEKALADLHGSFASLDQEQQKYAQSVIDAANCGELDVRPGLSFMDYINEFRQNDEDSEVKEIVNALGVDEAKLRELISLCVTEENINEYGRFDALIATVDKDKASKYFSEKEGRDISLFETNIKIQEKLRSFITSF